MRSPNDEGSQFSKLHFPCNKEERLVLNSFFREYNLYLKKKTLNLFKVAYHPVSCLLHLHISKIILLIKYNLLIFYPRLPFVLRESKYDKRFTFVAMFEINRILRPRDMSHQNL